MKNFKLTSLILEEDKPQIQCWHDYYFKKPEYNTIFKYILENGTIKNLDELIETNYERFPIGQEELKFLYVAKTEEGEILGFTIFQIFDINSKNPEMFLQYIVINPAYQNKGYGSQIFRDLFTNIKEYTGVSPKKVFAFIDQENYQSQKLFTSFGFDFEEITSKYLRANASMMKIEKAISQNQFQ